MYVENDVVKICVDIFVLYVEIVRCDMLVVTDLIHIFLYDINDMMPKRLATYATRLKNINIIQFWFKITRQYKCNIWSF